MESEISYSEYNKPFSSSQNNSGLLRFRSAPSSFLANWDGKSEKINEDESSCFNSSKASINGDYAFNSQFPPEYPRTSGNTRLISVNGSYRAQSLDLMRQISTHSELFSPSSSQIGYGFSSAIPSTLGMLSRISEIENENIEMNSTSHDRKFGDGYRDSSFYGSGLLPFSSWNNSTKFGDGLKTEMDCNDDYLISDIQGGGGGAGGRGPRNRLSRHLSMPKSSSSSSSGVVEVESMDKFLHLQDSVPCKFRAKRGCATHPRSIAERVRRTKISERMRKLQELVPNMEKQTNTSDMLDLAVDYIKELQKQYKTLSDIRSKCKCSSRGGF